MLIAEYCGIVVLACVVPGGEYLAGGFVGGYSERREGQHRSPLGVHGVRKVGCSVILAQLLERLDVGRAAGTCAVKHYFVYLVADCRGPVFREVQLYSRRGEFAAGFRRSYGGFGAAGACGKSRYTRRK